MAIDLLQILSQYLVTSFNVTTAIVVVILATSYHYIRKRSPIENKSMI
jgi:hypothetical protein